MYWRYPNYLWVEIVPVIVIIAWALAEWIRHRHLKEFGDPRVLGISIRWVPRILALLLLALGLGSAASLIPLPAANREKSVSEVPEIVILLDAQSMDPPGDQLWEALDRAIQTILEQAPGCRYTVQSVGWPPEPLVYPTIDATGLQIIVSRLRFESQRGSRLGLSEILARYDSRQQAEPHNSHFVVVTASPAEDVERLPPMRRAGAPQVLFVRLSRGDAPTQYGYRAAAGDWTWSTRAIEIRSRLKADSRQLPLGRLSLAQCIALLAVVLLGAEYVCSRAARSSTVRS